MEEVQTNISIYSHALLRIHIIGGQRSVRIAPPSLPPHHSGPATIHDYSYIDTFMIIAIDIKCHALWPFSPSVCLLLLRHGGFMT